jgi:quercetin dioxygenase-like cupin family protein
MGERRVYRYEEADWHVPVAPGTDPEAAAEAGRQGAARRFLAQGDAGFYTQVVKLPPNFEAPVHSHDHAEVFMVLEGSCEFDGERMNRFDVTVVEANEPYGFTAGADGLSFLVVRQGEAAFAAHESEDRSERREPDIPASSERGPSGPAAERPRAEEW